MSGDEGFIRAGLEDFVEVKELLTKEKIVRSTFRRWFYPRAHGRSQETD